MEEPSHFPSPILYPGEHLETASGLPTLWKLIRGTENGTADPRPLVVFVPGAMHNARIAYGGHLGGRTADFLAYWLSRLGFDVLAISYPVESTPTLMPATAPSFGALDWARQAAEVSCRVIEAEKLSKHIVYVTWSLSGKTIEHFTNEAKSRGLTVDLCVPLCATPALSVLRGSVPRFELTKVGYATSPNVFSHFMDHIREQSSLNGDRLVIDEQSYRSDYLGATPDGLRAWGLRYDPDSKTFVEDEQVASGKTEFGSLPMIACITGTSPLDLRHAIADKATWGFMLTYKLLADINTRSRQGSRSFSLDTNAWQQLVSVVHSAPDVLSTSIPGNHFFFVGEKGAKKTAERIADFIEKANNLQQQIIGLLDQLYK